MEDSWKEKHSNVGKIVSVANGEIDDGSRHA